MSIITTTLHPDVSVEKGLLLAMQPKKVISVRSAIKIGSKRIERKKSKQLLKEIVNTFNYEDEPQSINTEHWTEGKW